MEQTVSEEVDQAGHLTDGDALEEEHLDELPDQAQHQPFLALAGVESVAVNPDHYAADRLGGVDGQGQVLVLLEQKLTSHHPQLSAHLEYRYVSARVDHPLVDGVGGGEVDHLAEDHAVVHLLVHVRSVFLKVKTSM